MNQNFHDLIKSMIAGTEKEAWLTSGRFLSPYQKKILSDHGWTTIKYTRMLYSNTDPLFYDIVTFCKIIGIPVRDLFERLI